MADKLFEGSVETVPPKAPSSRLRTRENLKRRTFSRRQKQTRPESRPRFAYSKTDFALSGKENRNSVMETHRFHSRNQPIRAVLTIYSKLENRLFVPAANTMHGRFTRLSILPKNSGQDWYIPLEVSRSLPNCLGSMVLEIAQKLNICAQLMPTPVGITVLVSGTAEVPMPRVTSG